MGALEVTPEVAPGMKEFQKPEQCCRCRWLQAHPVSSSTMLIGEIISYKQEPVIQTLCEFIVLDGL